MSSFVRLKHTRLFHGLVPTEIDSILHCLSAREQRYAKGTYLFHEGDSIHEVGIVTEGSLHLIKEDYWGNRALLSRIGEGEAFAEVFACLDTPLTFEVLAAEESQILFVDVHRMLTSCSIACPFHQRLMHNFLSLLAEKNRELAQKVDVLAQRSIRSKLMAYLSMQAKIHQAVSFSIPFTRQQLADYLGIDRSAMTVELGKMVREGILRMEKNHFELL